jgi:hypothetical protein
LDGPSVIRQTKISEQISFQGANIGTDKQMVEFKSVDGVIALRQLLNGHCVLALAQS